MSASVSATQATKFAHTYLHYIGIEFAADVQEYLIKYVYTVIHILAS